VRIEQSLRRLEGVVRSGSDVRKGTVWAAWSPASRLDLDRLKAQLFVWRGAVRFGAASATVAGHLHRDAEEWFLEAASTRQRFRLVAPPPSDRAGTAAWASLELLARDPGASVRVAGEVRAPTGGTLELVVTSVTASRR
jgi:hypothetical protein